MRAVALLEQQDRHERLGTSTTASLSSSTQAPPLGTTARPQNWSLTSSRRPTVLQIPGRRGVDPDVLGYVDAAPAGIGSYVRAVPSGLDHSFAPWHSTQRALKRLRT